MSHWVGKFVLGHFVGVNRLRALVLLCYAIFRKCYIMSQNVTKCLIFRTWEILGDCILLFANECFAHSMREVYRFSKNGCSVPIRRRAA